MPPKPGLHPRPDCFIHAMPAYLSEVEAAGLKWVAGFPPNREKALPQITGLLILNDPETGLPIAVMDATWITEMRTGAATAVAARYLARADSAAAAILGCGIQGQSNLAALAEVLPELERAYAYDIVPEYSALYAPEMRQRLGLEVEVVSSPREAVEAADVIVTAGPITKPPHGTIQPGWVQLGAFASAVDFDSYWAAGALTEFDMIATDDLAQFEYYRESVGYFQDTPYPYADLGQIAGGQQPGRSSSQQRTMTMNLGLAIEDVIVAKRIHTLAGEQGIGQNLPL